ncbi:DNA mismatch repair protein MutS [Paenibacillus sophorae]|uniref:DNA mismatch repair protein MutS n=1 Tax=Paenibacillus sophorae TaxID=1333845 RepID=A0A1H8G174_9BACL|nr:DNA mismatch repair protein MutS [Paenibacillus sophorae]QWU14056.1 DNA mismatch repair protein MutS [Paenibacillus sophorae]SEN37743.1 DNA mismatch repair protein MutS [Paenibacillus sophorae]
MAKYTPMIEQYLKVKEGAKDAFLFFRLGDFYEMFFDDALLASKELEITLTGREGGGNERIPMCGVPYHSAEGYIQRLIEKGYKVAICEQLDDPATTKGMVRRDIVRVVTPGTVMEGKVLADKSNNYLVCVTELAGMTALAACDLTTGELYVTSSPTGADTLRGEIGLYEPAEIIGDGTLLESVRAGTLPGDKPVVYTPWEKKNEVLARSQFGEAAWARLERERAECLALLISYLSETQRRSLGQLSQISSYEPGNYMILDPFTRRNLELTETVRERSKKGSLLWLLDRTETSMGARLLRRRIDKPLLHRSKVERRLEAVDYLYNQYIVREDLRLALKGIYDLERLTGRVAYGSANGRDLNALKLSLAQIPALKEQCLASGSSTLREIGERIDECADLHEDIERAIVDDPPVSVRDGGLIRPGYHARLDELREASSSGKRWIAELEAKERLATGIKSLKIGYNKVFGYYIEITRSNLASLPEGRYERKQTLANAERYVTPELKEKEALILEAQDKMTDLEYSLFSELRERLSSQIPRLQSLAEKVAEIDVYQSLAAVSAEQRFVKPTLTEGYDLKVEGGRHPVVEAVLKDASFIANGSSLTQDDGRILLITGPNMAGKSTYMRQVALICIMAQVGCFVPADKAEIPVIDRIFTRIGAADDLIGGQSTFMVEMADIQLMTDKATPRSLIIIDELGRGTSTSEGMAIAQAVIEYVHHHIGCKALVSTHFHELAHLEDSLNGLRNYSMAVQESGDKVNFLRKLIPGAADSSYGIYCARLAGLPGSIIDRAYGLLQHIEHSSSANAPAEPVSRPEARGGGEPASAGSKAVDIRETAGVAEAARETVLGTAAESEVYSAARPGMNVSSHPEGNLSVSEAARRETAVHLADRVEEESGVVQLSIFGDEEPRRGRKAAASHQGHSMADDIMAAVSGADLMNMTPLQAMQLLNDLKMKIKMK